MNIGSTFVANFQSSKAIEPGQRPLHDPTMASQFLPALDAATSNARKDVPLPERLAILLAVIALVRIQFRRSAPRSAPLLADGRDGIHHLFQHSGLVDVRSSVANYERDALGFDHKMALRARFAAIRWIRPGRFAPPGAGTLPASREARDQSSWSAWERRSSKSTCNRSQIPALCQSRRRRQQVMPLPQPISGGNASHGMPVASTNRMPVSTARLGMRGRPPLSFLGSLGSNGSMTAHSSSLTSGLAMSPSYQGFC